MPKARPTSFARSSVPAPSLPDFDHIQRFFDPRLKAVSAKILPGEFYATVADEMVTTLLGSCVAACIWDPVAKIGGMNHFLIPEGANEASAENKLDVARYGVFAMEFLINSILKNGGERERLVAKLTGGGHVLQSSTPIGASNVRFARKYLADEGIEVLSEHVEGEQARRVAFHPLSGRCLVQELASATSEVSKSERAYASSIERPADPGEIELF